MRAGVFFAGVAFAVPEEAGHRIGAAKLQRLAKHIQRFIDLHACIPWFGRESPCASRIPLSGKGEGALDAADEILLADQDAVVAQDVVGGGDVEIEIRQAGVVHIVQAAVFALGVFAHDHDLACFGAGKGIGRQRLDEGDGVGDAGLVLGQRGFGVLEVRHVGLGQAGADAFGEIAGDLDLPAEREHVGGQACAEQGGDVEADGFGVGLGFVQAGVEGAQGAGEGGNGGVKKRWVHGGLQMGVSSSHVLLKGMKVIIQSLVTSDRFDVRPGCNDRQCPVVGGL